MQWTSAPNIGEAPLPQRARGYWKARFSAAVEELERLLEAERAQLPPWLAVGFGSGIAAWFAFGTPGEWKAFLCIATALALAGFVFGTGRAGRALGWFALAATLGCALIWARSAWVAQPRLERPQVSEFAAEVRKVEPLAARGVVRLTLAPADPALPPLVRVNVANDDAPPGLARRSSIRLRARLMPPPPLALPGSHDFGRDFWFMGVGASGRALGPVAVVRASEPSGLDDIRRRLDRHIASRLPGPSGTIAIAFATGNQNAIGEEDTEAMRRSGLAHLLSVGGLHITAIVGIAFFLVLRILALVEPVALRFNLVIVAAGAGALAAIGYTVLTGTQVPMVRSCIAALLILGGMMLGREAISLRALAVAALLILLYRPEALVGPSFQLTFAAVGAIIALHSTQWARKAFQRRDEHLARRILRGATAIAVTGLAVELAVMPFALFHFHRAGPYGVLANVIAIPLTEMLIMPLEALSLALDSVGLGRPAWVLTGAAIDLLLGLAHRIAAVTRLATVPEVPLWGFACCVAGLLWLGLWRSRVRLLGLGPILAGVAATFLAPRPDLLVTGDGRHLALVEEGTPLILRDRAGDYVRSLLAEASGFDGDPAALGSRRFSACSDDACVARIMRGERAWRLLATRSSTPIDWHRITRACSAADIVVSDRSLPRGCTPAWLKLDRTALGRTGGLAVYLGDTPRVESVAEAVGEHPWAPEPAPWRPNLRVTATPPAHFPTGR